MYVTYSKKGGVKMIAKHWKKVLLAIVVIACLFNVVRKFVFHPSIEEELKASSEYVQENEK